MRSMNKEESKKHGEYLKGTSEPLPDHAVLGEVEALKAENKLLHNVCDEINDIFWNNFMIKGKPFDINKVRDKIGEQLNKWVSI